jgi:hypothetical protein
MRQRDFASHQRVIISDVRPLINGAMLQLHGKAGAKLLKIKLIPPDAQLFAECFCLLQGKNLLFVDNIVAWRRLRLSSMWAAAPVLFSA